MPGWFAQLARRVARGPLPVGLTIVAAIAVSACSTAPAQRVNPPVTVSVVTLQPRQVTLTTVLPGRTAPYVVAEIRPQVSGIIQRRPFVEGTDVAAGSLLYQIDPAPYRATLDQATASLAMAEANLPALRSRAARLKELAAVHAVGQQDSDDASSALASAEASAAAAKAAVETAQINLDYTPVRSPISGRIGRSSVTVGALVTAYQPTPLAVVQQLDPIYVDVTQASADVLRLTRRLERGDLRTGGRSQARVRLLLEDGTPYPVEGTLQFRDVSVDPTTGSVILRMVFPNPRRTLLPGMFVRGIVEEGVNEQAILAPQQGITRDVKGNPQALVVNPSDVVELRQVDVDRTIGTDWLVIGGLGSGDRLIVEGMDKVRPGAKVRAVPFTPAHPPQPGAPAAK
jgi:membrane fusion protein (multidrug efflux system)